MSLRIGFQLSSITPHLQTPEELQSSLRKVADIGYRFVQLQGVPTSIDDDIIVSALADAGLTCVATQEDYILGFGDDPDRAIARAKAVGAQYLTCALIPWEIDSVDSLAAFASTLGEVADRVHAAGLTFAFHPIAPDYRLLDGEMLFDRLMDLLPDHVHLTFCVFAALTAGIDPAIVFNRYAVRISLVHFKDDALQPDGSGHLTPLGQGSHDWAPILAACKAAHVAYVFAEQERWLKDAFESAQDSFAYVAALGRD